MTPWLTCIDDDPAVATRARYAVPDASSMPCPSCAHAETPVFFRMPRIPVLCNVLHRSREEALAAPCAEMALACCTPSLAVERSHAARTGRGGCGLIFNAAFKPELMNYTGQYENALHFSPHFQHYAETLARSLVDRYDLHRKRLVEVGCGDGQFLAMLCRLGPNDGLGFDPAHDPSRSSEQANPGGGSIRIVREYYGPEHAHHPADFVACRHVLEHIPRPVEFLRNVRATIGGGNDTVVFFEVPNALWTLEQLGIWDLIYEHVNYFTPPSLRRAFALAGFEPLRTEAVYSGQFLTIEARPAATPVAPVPDPDDGRISTLVREFGGQYRAKHAHWQTLIDALRRREGTGTGRAVLWGAGSKGVTFLNVVNGADGPIRHIVDINPRKHGCFVAGSGQEIVPPEALRALKPAAVIIMNPAYRDEITRQLRSLGVAADVLVA